jgi:hypothetical protein
MAFTLSLTTVANAAAQFLGVLDSGESLSAQQLTDALAVANQLLDNWSSEGLFAVADLITSFTLTSGVQSYTIGAGQTINITRPVQIVAAAFKNAAGPGGPIKVINERDWAEIPDRQRLSWIIEKLFWDRGNPTGSIYISPVPQGTGLSAEIHSYVPLTQFADVTTAISILPGYARFLELGLAIELAPQYDMAPSQTLMANFGDAAARIRKLNASLLGEVPSEVAQGAA